MRTLTLFVAAATLSTPLPASENRQLDAHEHGVGQLDIALEGQEIAMELHVPGADIVGFEYAAQSAEDREKVDKAVATLARPLELFILPTAAACSVVRASASLESESAEAEHAHDEHAHDEHAHEEHAHDEHAAEGHTEFHAEYLLTCADLDAVQEIAFAYFDVFPNAKKLEVQVISGAGASAFDVVRDTPSLDLRGMF